MSRVLKFLVFVAILVILYLAFKELLWVLVEWAKDITEFLMLFMQ